MKRRQMIQRSTSFVGSALFASLAGSQVIAAPEPEPVVTTTPIATVRIRFRFTVTASTSAVRNVIATGPLPIDWPEQKVKLIGEEKSPGASIREQKFAGQALMALVRFPFISARQTHFVEREYELTRSQLDFVGPTNLLVKPERPTKQLRQFLGGGVGVEPTSQRIRKLAEETCKGENDWERVRSVYTWVRANIKYVMGSYRGAAETLRAGVGDCEDVASVFVSICRSSGIPARTVWVHDHAYEEFYLESPNGTGHWIPAQSVGVDWFGHMQEIKPILQKGDRFRDAITRRYSHYVPQSSQANGPIKLSNSRMVVSVKRIDAAAEE